MRKTIKRNKLNHKPQAHARVCEENQEKNDCLLKYLVVKRSTLEAYRRTMIQPIAIVFATQILHSIKVLVL